MSTSALPSRPAPIASPPPARPHPLPRPDLHRRLARGCRIVSSYPVGEGRVWIITEADRSATTLLLAPEY